MKGNINLDNPKEKKLPNVAYKGYAVFTNEDLTEGRGGEFVMAVTENVFTAQRIAKGKYVQGLDCPIKEVDLFKHEGMWYGPVRIVFANQEDRQKEKEKLEQEAHKKEQNRILAKAKKLGLTEDEINILKCRN